MQIVYKQQNSSTYATVMHSYRDGGKPRKKVVHYLGKVLDKEKGIYSSQSKGVVCYDLQTDTFTEAPPGFKEPEAKRFSSKPKLSIDFGDSFLMTEFSKQIGLDEVLDSIPFRNPDSVKALLLFYILSDLNNNHAADWFDGNYARILYPKANLGSQRISDLLDSIGEESSFRDFYRAYFQFLRKNEKNTGNVVIDSTGMPNSIHFPLTAVSNHNGEVSEEIRLIYVVHQHTRLPIYFRYVPGNVIDSTTLVATIEELRTLGVNIDLALVDAGYTSQECLGLFFEHRIHFLSRCPTNRTIFKEAVDKYLDNLESPENLVLHNGKLFNGRQIFMVKFETLYKGFKLFSYFARDMAMKEEHRKGQITKAMNGDCDIDAEKLVAGMRTNGVFMLISSKDIPVDQVLCQYYVRQDIEQVFDITKNHASLMPLCVRKESTLRGHLLVTFIATILLQSLQNKLKDTKFSLDDLSVMRNQKVWLSESVAIPQEIDKKQREIYKLLNIKVPKKIPLEQCSTIKLTGN